MHMDKAGFLWPCGGCTNSGNWMYCHEIYCPCNIMCDCNLKLAMKDNPSDEVCIPVEFKDAYETFSYPELCKRSMSLFHAVARNCGGVYFNLKSVLGGLMLLEDNCDEIICIASHETSRNNLSKAMDDMEKLDTTKIVVNVCTKSHSSNVTTTTNNKKKETVEDIKSSYVNNKKDNHVEDEVMK